MSQIKADNDFGGWIPNKENNNNNIQKRRMTSTGCYRTGAAF